MNIVDFISRGICAQIRYISSCFLTPKLDVKKLKANEGKKTTNSSIYDTGKYF